MPKLPVKRNLLKSNARHVSKTNVSFSHIHTILMELHDYLEVFEERDDIRVGIKAKNISQMLTKVSTLLTQKLEHEVNKLEYIRRKNRERQNKMTDDQLSALYEPTVKEMFKRENTPFNEEMVEIRKNQMIQAYRDTASERENENKEIKDHVEKKIEDFNSKEGEFNIENPH